MSNRIMGRQSFYQLITCNKWPWCTVMWADFKNLLKQKFKPTFLSYTFVLSILRGKNICVSGCDICVSISPLNWINWFISTWKMEMEMCTFSSIYCVFSSLIHLLVRSNYGSRLWIIGLEQQTNGFTRKNVLFLDIKQQY